MKVVLDEGVPHVLAKALTAEGVDTDRFDKGWEGLTNGLLLARVEAAGYAVLLTNDRNMAFQQNLEGRGLAVVALPTSQRRIVMARLDVIADTIRCAKPGRHLVMNADGTRRFYWTSQGKQVAEDLPPVRKFFD